MEEEQKDVVFNDYEEKVKKQVEELLLSQGIYLESFEVTIDRDADSKTFGEIQYMDITASIEYNEVEEKENRLQIDEIDIAQIEIREVEEDAKEALPSPQEINLKNELSDFYNIEQGNINITIQGG
jgi:stage III sporulation protein AF